MAGCSSGWVIGWGPPRELCRVGQANLRSSRDTARPPLSSARTLMASYLIAPRVEVCDVDDIAPVRAEPRIVLRQYASQAFGDGSHPTTKLCGRAVDLLCRQRRPKSMLDVGTGTGVLARLACHHQVAHVVGTDIDPSALQVAARNAQLDLPIPAPHWSGRPPQSWGPVFDVVVANILEDVLMSLSEALFAALSEDGQLLLSGFLKPQTPALRHHFSALGLRLRAQVEHESWALLHFERAACPAV